MHDPHQVGGDHGEAPEQERYELPVAGYGLARSGAGRRWQLVAGADDLRQTGLPMVFPAVLLQTDGLLSLPAR